MEADARTESLTPPAADPGVGSITRRAMRVAWDHLRPLRIVALMTVVLTLTASLLESVSLGLLVPIMEEVQRQDRAPASDVFSQTSATVLSWLGAPYGFVSLMVLFAVLMALKYSFQAWLDYLSKRLSAGLKCILHVKIYDSLMRAPRAFYHQRPVGGLISTTYTSADEAGALGEGAVRLVSSVLSAALFVGVQAIISPALTVVSLTLTGFSYYFVMPRIRKTYEYGGDLKARMDRMISLLQETLSGIGTVKAFGRERYHGARFSDLNQQFLGKALEIQKNKIVIGLFMEPYMMALVVLLIVVSVTLLDLGIAPLITFFVVFSRLAPKLKQVNLEYVTIVQNLPHFLKAQELIDLEPAPAPADGVRITSLETDIVYEDVWLKYSGRDQHALAGVSFALQHRKTTALVGSSGGGKSTIANILLGHYRVESGRMTVNGRDFAEIDRDSWLKLIGVVDQEPFLFHGSVAENIRYGKLGATDVEVQDAARLANAEEFISCLPQRYETTMGDRGVGLSVGQKQRIALARALIRNPELLVLDEATSALDSVSEQLIHRAIDRFHGQKTVLIIAHRLSTIVDADHILFIEAGRIVESGNHEALLNRDGQYAMNYRLQAL